MTDRNKPLVPEIVPSSPEKRGEVSTALRPIGNTALSAYFARRIAESQTASVQALTKLGKAMLELEGVKQEFRDLKTTLDAESAERKLRKFLAEEKLAEAKRRAATAAQVAQLRDELEIIELEERLAAAKARRTQSKPPLDEEARRQEAIRKKFREKMGRLFTEQEVRAHAAHLIEEIKARAKGNITQDVQREIANIEDVMEDILKDL